MIEETRRWGYPFPYLIDETQAVAKAFRAACTPDFYLFDAERRLAYRGQFDESRPGGLAPVTGRDLRAAADALLSGRPRLARPARQPRLQHQVEARQRTQLLRLRRTTRRMSDAPRPVEPDQAWNTRRRTPRGSRKSLRKRLRRTLTTALAWGLLHGVPIPSPPPTTSASTAASTSPAPLVEWAKWRWSTWTATETSTGSPPSASGRRRSPGGIPRPSPRAGSGTRSRRTSSKASAWRPPTWTATGIWTLFWR